jgi:hypothetical protein
MIEINLLPDVKLELLKAQKVRSMVVIVSVVIGIVAAVVLVLLSVYVFGVQLVRNQLSDSTITSEYKTISKTTDLSKMLTIQNQLSELSQQYDSKTVTSRLFAVLSSTLPSSPNNISLSDISIDTTSDTITLQGQAPTGYIAVETFKKTIGMAVFTYKDSSNDGNAVTKNLASNIVITNTSYGEDASGNKVLRFTVSFNYDSSLFAPTSAGAIIRNGTTGNVTDSYLELPTSIFKSSGSNQ